MLALIAAHPLPFVALVAVALLVVFGGGLGSSPRGRY